MPHTSRKPTRHPGQSSTFRQETLPDRGTLPNPSDGTLLDKTIVVDYGRGPTTHAPTVSQLGWGTSGVDGILPHDLFTSTTLGPYYSVPGSVSYPPTREQTPIPTPQNPAGQGQGHVSCTRDDRGLTPRRPDPTGPVFQSYE